MEKLKRLFFTKGFVPTPDESRAAASLGFEVFRNAAACRRLERADEVAGAVPDGYKRMKGAKIIGTKAPEAAGGK